MTTESFIENYATLMATAPRKPGAAAVRLYGGPFDGATCYVEASVLLRVIRADGALCLPTDDGGVMCAAYRLQSGGPIYQGVDAFYRGQAAYSTGAVDGGG